MTNEVPYEGFKWITLVTDSQPEVAIVLSQPHAGRSREDGDALAAMLAKGELGTINFRTDDLDATFEKVAAVQGCRGAPGAGQPVLGSARLRRPRPRGQHRPHRTGLNQNGDGSFSVQPGPESGPG